MTTPLYRAFTAHRRDPLGIPARYPLLSWSASPDAPLDAGEGFEVRVAASEDGLFGSNDLIWEGRTRRPWLVYDGPQLRSRDRRYWHVTGRTTRGEVTAAPPASFEVGLTEAADWMASWIAARPLPYRREGWNPSPYLRRTFRLNEVPTRARLYASALGLYRVWVNGTELTSDALFRPGWTDYRRRVYHQTYDCSHLLRPNENVVAVTLANGWYAGWIGLVREPGFYGDRPAFLAQMEGRTAGGAELIVGTDESWRVGYGALLATDLLRGETQDLRQEPQGWREGGFDDDGWEAPQKLGAPEGMVIEPQPHGSIRRFETHPGRVVHEHAHGNTVFDFGQNLVGWTRIDSPVNPSVELIVRHGEVLTPLQTVYRDNLRGAFQEDRYIVGDRGQQRLETQFTLHGFRYAEVLGLPGAPVDVGFKLHPDTSVSAVSVAADHDQVGHFECSDQRLNALAHSIEWTIRDNFLEVATDCPQRDERRGWLGDAGVIAPAAAYIFDVAAFFAKFAQDAADAQTDDGAIPSYVPATPPADRVPGAPGWADGFVRLIHLLVERYGALTTADRQFAAIERYLDHLDRHNPNGIRVEAVGADFGDWLSLPEHGGHTVHPGYEFTGAYSTSPRPVVATAHSYRSFVQASEIAARLGRDERARRYAERAEEVRQAYRNAFVRADGTIEDATQTVYAQAVGFGILQGDGAETAIERLCVMIRDQGHITAGIHGTEHVLPVLARHGHGELAMEMLLREDYPSWLFMLANGATTIWERWDSIGADGSISSAEMNSFNHCALGSVGRFLYEDVGGVRATTTAWDGLVVVRCLYPRTLTWVSTSYESPVGLIESAWRWAGDQVTHRLVIPMTAHAEVRAPGGMAVRSAADPDADPADRLRLGPGRHELTIATDGTTR